MNPRAQIRLLPDGRRLHLHDGPIDLIVEAFGAPHQIEAAYRAASHRFVTVLDELCSELNFLRQPTQVVRVGRSQTQSDQSSRFSREAAKDCSPGRKPWEKAETLQSPEGAKEASSQRLAPADDARRRGAVARRMVAAVTPFASETFITPMAAVAGAVAEEILQAMTNAAELSRAYVNDGGDIALHLSPGEQFTIGMVERPDRPSLFGTTKIDFSDAIRGIATSGWRGRSFSLGIADAVTVLAGTASMADAAATIIANAVDLPGHPAITRVRARDLAPDNDLGDRLVTHEVGELTPAEVETALSAGMRVAENLRAKNLIRAAAINLQNETLLVGAQHTALDEGIAQSALGKGTASAVPMVTMNETGFSR